MSTLWAVRAALEGRLARACRVCLAADAVTDFAFVFRLPTGVYTLREILAQITHSEVVQDGTLPAGLCDECLQSCLHSFSLLSSYRHNAASLERCLHMISQYMESNHAEAIQEEKHLFIPVLPQLIDYQVADKCAFGAEEIELDIEPELKQFHCTMCASSYTTELLLKQHELSHPPGTEHICRECGRMYKHRVILNRHVSSKHGDPQSFLCVTCGKTYASAVGLNFHQASQHGRARVESSTMLDDDVSYQSNVKEEPHDAEGEDEYVPTKQSKDQNVMCDICAMTFKRPMDLKKHIKSRHTMLECPECGKSFKVRSYYEAHVLRHSKTREELKVHRCEYCAYATDKKFLLTCHTRRRHTHVRPYVCELCGKAFYIRREVTLHMSVHTKERPECCKVCSKRFVNKTALLFHSRLHTGERPYACPACPERFLSPSRRGAHVRSKHMPRPQCRLCLATFTDKQVLKKHIQKVHCKSGGGVTLSGADKKRPRELQADSEPYP